MGDDLDGVTRKLQVVTDGKERATETHIGNKDLKELHTGCYTFIQTLGSVASTSSFVHEASHGSQGASNKAPNVFSDNSFLHELYGQAFCLVYGTSINLWAAGNHG